LENKKKRSLIKVFIKKNNFKKTFVLLQTNLNDVDNTDISNSELKMK